MGYASEMMIEEHNARMQSDAEYAEDFSRQMDEAQFQNWLEVELETERLIDWFDDYRIAADGYEENIEPQPTVLVDDDIPF